MPPLVDYLCKFVCCGDMHSRNVLDKIAAVVLQVVYGCSAVHGAACTVLPGLQATRRAVQDNSSTGGHTAEAWRSEGSLNDWCTV